MRERMEDEMEESKGGGHRGRMRDQALIISRLLDERRCVTIAEVAEAIEASEATARRWIDCFSTRLPLRIERGVVVREE